MYLHAGLGTGPVVQGLIREEGQMRLKRFVARNLKPIFPIAWKKELAGDMLVQIDPPLHHNRSKILERLRRLVVVNVDLVLVLEGFWMMVRDKVLLVLTMLSIQMEHHPKLLGK